MAASPDIAPEGKRNRPAPGKDDLEQYGVWVKAEPQDISADLESAAGLDGDFSLPEESYSLPEESFLTEEEERLLGSFDEIESETPPAKSPMFSPDSDFSSLPDIEDFEPGETPPRAAPQVRAKPEAAGFDFSLEDLQSGFSQPEISPATPIDMSSVQGLEAEVPDLDISLDIEEEALPTTRASSGQPGPDLEDVSADFLDSGAATAPSSGTSAGETHDVTDEFLLDTEEPAAGGQGLEESVEADFEPLDIELQFDDSARHPELGARAETGFEEVSEFDDYLSSGEAAASEGFDDLAALEKDLREETPEGRRPPAKRAEPEPTLANDLLLKIANELSSIRSELVNLKSQLGAVRAEAASAGQPEPEAAPEEEQAQAGGFFDEEDDEKIALTGDELDNILSSADFTEERQAEEGSISPSDFGMEDAAPSQPPEPLLPETGDYSNFQASEPVARISLDEEEGIPESPASLEESHQTLAKLAQEGIQPLTSPPEDTSYLEEPLVDEAAIDLGETPLMDAPLVEPDLSELSIDLPEQEEQILGDELPVVSGDELLSDMTLDIEAMPSEAEALPAISEEILPEFEDTGFADISLEGEKAGAQPLESAEDFLGGEGGEFELHHEDKGDTLPSFDEAAEESFASTAAEEEAFALPEEAEAAEPEAPVRAERPAAQGPSPAAQAFSDPDDKLKSDIRSVLSYLDRLLESLPEEKIEEFARSEHFDTYKKLFEDLGLV